MDQHAAADATLKVFYDGACPLCSREIAFYRRRGGPDEIEWVDVNEAPQGALPHGLTRDRALAQFHVAAGQGVLYSGARAFAELWTAMPGFRFLGRLAKLPPVCWVLEIAYKGFLPMRPLLQGLARRKARSMGLMATPPRKAA